MAFDLPNEIWKGILKRLTTMQDLGRIQQVSRAFNAIIREECWVRVKELTLNYSYIGYILRKDKHGETLYSLDVDKRSLRLSEDKLLLLVDELGKKATKIQSVSLDRDRDDELFYGVLQRLTSASLKIQDLTLLQGCFSGPVDALADFVCSISGTLKDLHLSCLCYEPDFSRDLIQAFRQCRALESVELDMDIDYDSNRVWFYDRLLESVLFGASQLKELTLLTCFSPYFTSALLTTGAHLSNCDLEWHLLDNYVRDVQRRNLASTDHPLKSLKTLTLSGDHQSLLIPPMGLFPDLQQLHLEPTSAKVTPEDVNHLISGFLSEYKEASGEPRLLSLIVYRIPGFWSLEEVTGALDWPVSWAEESELFMEFKFIRGNANTKLLIRRRERYYSDYSD